MPAMKTASDDELLKHADAARMVLLMWVEAIEHGLAKQVRDSRWKIFLEAVQRVDEMQRMSVH